jgi:hypothetical protein
MTMTKTRYEEKINALMYILISLFFIIVFLSFFRISLWDYDFWWHIATGKYIVQHKEIPSEDPFSFVTEINRGKYPLSEAREKFLMRQYWLSQVVMYFIYEKFGPTGIRFLRAFLLASSLFLIFLGFRHFRISPLWSMVMIIPVFYVFLRKYTGERPVLFTFFFAILVTVMLEKLMDSKNKGIYFLPLIMLLWSNMHGGFILGIVIIAIYLLSETLLSLFKKSSLGKQDLRVFLAVSLISIIVTVLNPNGWLVFARFHSKNEIFRSGINEYMPLLTVYLKHYAPLNGAVIVVLAFVVIMLVIRIFKMPIRKSLLVTGILIMSLKHQRFFAFTALIGVFLLGLELKKLYNSGYFRTFITPQFSRITSLLLIGGILIFSTQQSFAFAKALKQKESITEEYKLKPVIDFIEQARLPGRMFNADAFGGYILWRLYPWKKVFTDTRLIDIASLVEYNTIMAARSEGKTEVWQKLLEIYDINFLVLKPLEYDGSLTRLVDAALESEKWTLIYADGVSLVFIRDVEDNSYIIRKFQLEDDQGYWTLIGAASFKAMKNTKNHRLFLTIGKCFMKLRKLEEAKKAFNHVLKIDRGNKEAEAFLRKIDQLLLNKTT